MEESGKSKVPRGRRGTALLLLLASLRLPGKDGRTAKGAPTMVSEGISSDSGPT